MKHSMLRGTLATLILIPALCFAQANTPNLDQRQINQEKRIEKGIQSGQLTGKEAENLGNRQDKLEAAKQQAKADGVVSKQERRALHRKADRNSRKIYQKKHNQKTATPSAG